ncbi:unnamed protein product [Schistocephalus solidus]|uniref:Uncharacterized protein n=1 Tax=Schistocephalus solidus TaxID=70667 RepID=A0A3P7D6U6_SCHSO|nr:unnamed protein product [Schistocephalus solidus]
MNLLSYYLNARKQRVEIFDGISNTTHVRSGVIQGCVLNLLLFCVFVNDVTDCFQYGRPFVYADDIKVAYRYKPVDRNIVLELLKKEAQAFAQWCHTWRLSLSWHKCSVMVIGDNHQPLLSIVLDLLSIDLAGQEDAWKVQLLLRKLNPAEHERYVNLILLKKQREITFTDMLKMSQIFGEQSSLFNARSQRLQLCKRESDDLITYAGNVDRNLGRFQLGFLTEHQFKCLMIIYGLHSPKDADIQTRLLSQVHQNSTVTLQLNAADRRKFVYILLNGHTVCLQLNIASDITIISERLWQSLGSPTMQQISLSATSVCGDLVWLMRQLQCCVCFRGTTIKVICFVTKSNLNRLGLDWIEQLGLVNMPLRVVRSQVQIPVVLADPTKDILQWLIFGAKIALALFQQTANAVLSSIPGTAGYLNDIIFMGRSPTQLKTECVQYLNACRNMAFT